MISALFTGDHAMKKNDGSLTDAQLQAELNRCEYCEEKPCKDGLPGGLLAGGLHHGGEGRREIRLSAAPGRSIMGSNPLGWVCGVVCPDYFCMKACSRRTFDQPINIPAVQASVMKRAYEAGLRASRRRSGMGNRLRSSARGRRDWARPACSPSGATKSRCIEQRKRLGGMMNLIPDFRLDKKVVRTRHRIPQGPRRAGFQCRQSRRQPGRTAGNRTRP